ncbi:MAG: hypothetical protein ACKOCM_05230, partial [Cyanobacteriota bacterium]
ELRNAAADAAQGQQGHRLGPRPGQGVAPLLDRAEGRPRHAGGGGIFEQLPIRPEPAEAFDFERLFAMPQAVDPLALAAAHGVPGRPVSTAAELEPALRWALPHPLALVRLVSDRRADGACRQRLRALISERLRGALPILAQQNGRQL